jgi:hypothetical protein
LLVLDFDLLEKLYLLLFHEVDFLDVLRKPSLAFVEIYFLLVLIQLLIHF